MALKQARTAEELANIICAKINLDGVKVTVRSSCALGWVALVMVVPARVDRFVMQVRVDHEADALRNLYDLRPTPRQGPLQLVS
jgi:hypothetical protein